MNVWHAHYLGENPAPKVGTELVYMCPEGYLFEHDFYAPRKSIIRCGEDGKFSKPPFWPKCIIRKYNHKGGGYFENGSSHLSPFSCAVSPMSHRKREIGPGGDYQDFCFQNIPLKHI